MMEISFMAFVFVQLLINASVLRRLRDIEKRQDSTPEAQ